MDGQTEGKTNTLVGGFGVGCAQFCPKNQDQQFASFNSFVEALEASLGHITAIQNVDIEAESFVGNFRDSFPGYFGRLEDGDLPPLRGQHGIALEISLSLVIPPRRQRAILRKAEDDDWQPYDELSVVISYEYDLPIMLVLPTSGRPSDSVVLVRKFLREELENNPNSQFTFDCLGPSPFHADFWIYESAQQETDYRWERIVQRGYDDINFIFKRNARGAEGYLRTLKSQLCTISISIT